MRRKGRKPDKPYLEYIRSLMCECCYPRGRGDHVQAHVTEAAHVGVRGLGQKCDDRETIPLCTYHHRTGPDAQHVLQKRFWEHHGINRDELIARLQAEYELRKGESSEDLRCEQLAK